jgi:Domain of unknown function (DUF4157)
VAANPPKIARRQIYAAIDTIERMGDDLHDDRVEAASARLILAEVASMFAPPIAKPQAKTAGRSSDKSALRRAQAYGQDRIEQAQTSRRVPQTGPRFSDNEPLGATWGLTEIPLSLYPPGRTSESERPSPTQVPRLPSPIQRKLKVGTIDDSLDHGADPIAKQAMQTSERRLHRTCACGGECPKCQTEKRGQGPARLQNNHVGAGDPGHTAAPPIVYELLRSPGQPLDAATRAFMEPRFGQDFSRVRVHTDARAARAARLIDAEAYTVGNDIAFAVGRFDLASQAGRGLLAHELAHTLQQRGTIHGRRGDAVSRAGDPDERAADAAAATVLADRPAPELAPAAPVVARRPAASARPGFLIQVVLNEKVDGREFCIRAVMQGHEIGRDEAEQLVGSGRLRCYGWASTRGVDQDWVGHPIPFWVGGDLGSRDDAHTGAGADVKVEPGEKAEVDAETDQRFWARIGEIRMLSKGDPGDAAYRELWKAERARVLWERRDPFGPELRTFAALGDLPAVQSIDDIHPYELDAMLEVKAMLGRLTARDWIRLRRVGLPKSDWQGLAEWLPKFIAQQRADDQVVERVRELDKIGGLDSAYGTVHGEGRGSRDPAAPEAFERSGELEQAAGEFKAMFRTRALEKAVETFRGLHAAMEAVSKRRLPSREENNALFALLQRANGPEDLPEGVLRNHPVLRDPATFKSARNTMYASDLGGYLARRAAACAADAKYLSEHIVEKPDAVFNFDAIVNATLEELGLDSSVHAQIIEWGKSDGSGLFDSLLHLGLFVMLFVPYLDVLAAGYFAVESGAGLYGEVVDYNAEMKKWARGERPDRPSPWGVVGATVQFDLSVLPFAHGFRGTKGVTGAEGLLERSGSIEGLGGEGRTPGVGPAVPGRGAAVEGETAAVPIGTNVAEARVGGEMTDATGAAGVEPTTPALAEPAKPVQTPAPAGTQTVPLRSTYVPRGEEPVGTVRPRAPAARPFLAKDPNARPGGRPPRKPPQPQPPPVASAAAERTPAPTGSSKNLASNYEYQKRVWEGLVRRYGGSNVDLDRELSKIQEVLARGETEKAAQLSAEFEKNAKQFSGFEPPGGQLDDAKRLEDLEGLHIEDEAHGAPTEALHRPLNVQRLENAPLIGRPYVRTAAEGAGASYEIRGDLAEFEASRRGYHVYEYLDENGNLLYVGKSGSIQGEKRIEFLEPGTNEPSVNNWIDRLQADHINTSWIGKARYVRVSYELTDQEMWALEDALIPTSPNNIREGEYAIKHPQGDSYNAATAMKKPQAVFGIEAHPVRESR